MSNSTVVLTCLKLVFALFLLTICFIYNCNDKILPLLFQVLNLFLALLINAFASDNLKANSDKEEDNKMLAAVRRIKELCCCCLSKKVAPNEAAIEEGMELSSDIESINSNGKHTAVLALY